MRSCLHRGTVHIATGVCAAGLVLCGLTYLSVADDNSGQPADRQKPAEITVLNAPVHTTPIQMDVNMVVVNVTVTDPYDRIVTGLDQSNFQIYYDKV